MNDDANQSPKDKRRERTRKELLRAAAQVFTQKGFHEATIQEIAQLAEFSAGSLYNYFENKDALFLDLSQDVFEAFQDNMATPLPEGDLSLRLHALVHRLFQFADEHRDHFRFFALLQWSGGLSMGKDMGGRARAQQDLMHQFVQRFFDDALARGELPRSNTEACASLLLGALMANTFHWFHDDNPPRLTERTDEVADLVLHGILHVTP
ncbi:MAG: TetR/AcrR family transcriptional regulator [Pseudomonadota bacterium]